MGKGRKIRGILKLNEILLFTFLRFSRKTSKNVRNFQAKSHNATQCFTFYD